MSPILEPVPAPPPPGPREVPPFSQPVADLDKVLTPTQLATVLGRLRSQKLTDAKAWPA